MKKSYYIIGGMSVCVLAVGSYFLYKFIKKKLELKKESDEINESLDKNLPKKEYVEVKNEHEEIREKLLKNWNKPPLGVSDINKELAESEHPVDSDEDEDNYLDDDALEEGDDEDSLKKLEDEALEKAKDLDKFYEMTSDKEPEVISSDAVGDYPESFEVIDWYYWDVDKFITDDEENIIEDYSRFIGNSLEDSGFINDPDESDIYVVSYKFSTIYYIHKYLLPFKEQFEEDE